MYLYSIMPLKKEHVNEICNDIKRQYDEGIATLALFFVKLVPEGDPAVDKAGIFAEDYVVFRDKLASMGLKCGILVQCTLGHGYPLDNMFGFTQCVNLKDGSKEYVACPYDENFRSYLKEQFSTLSALDPEVIMVDDDFRLMFRYGKGCACSLHMERFNSKIGKTVTREELFGVLKDNKNVNRKKYTDAYIDTQRESLVGAAKAIREGIDAINPKIQGVICTTSHTTEFGAETARILAGKGNPAIARLYNGNYGAVSARYVSSIAYRFAQQSEILKNEGVDYVLAETDTCPHNRYSTSAQSLHTHMTISILEGACGAKHWITRLPEYEPKSGEAYRKKLAKYSRFYEKLSAIRSDYKRVGCRIPLPHIKDYGFTKEGWYSLKDSWSRCVLERYGVPLYYSAQFGGATFIEGDTYIFSDKEILEMLKGPFFIASDAAKELCERGFSEHLGVTVREWTGPNPSFERINENRKLCLTQVRVKELVPNGSNTVCDSTIYHLENGKDEIPIAPGVTVFKNSLGGTAVCFAGSPNTNFIYTEFGFLTESRKEQIVRLICDNHGLPIYFDGDEEVYMNCGVNHEGELLVSIFNIGLDPIEDVTLKTELKIKRVSMLQPDGSIEPVDFSFKDGLLTVSRTVYTHDPLVLFIGI